MELTADGVVRSSEAVTELRKKRAQPLLLATLRIGANASSTGRARAVVRDAEASWHTSRAPGVLLRRRAWPGGSVARRIRALEVPIGPWPALLNAEEASGLVGLPIDADSIPGVNLRGCRPLPVAPDTPVRGTVLGDGTHPRTVRPLALDDRGRTHHALIVGPTGSGKSVLETHLAVHDAAVPGRAVVVIDPKDGELVDGIVERLPEQRIRDVVVFDPTDDRPVGFDPLRSTPATRELVVERVLGLMVEIWKDNLGPRSADILRHVLLTIAAADDLTLTEAPSLIVDENFRRRVLAIHDPGFEVRAWWSWVDGLGTAEWSAMTQAPLNKLRAFVGRSPVADTIGQPEPAIDFSRMLSEGRVLLVRLPVGLLGDETTSLLGAMLINQLWHAIASRAALPKEARQTASVIVDEVGTVLRFPASSLDTMLTQARGYGVGVTLAAQHLSQLPSDVRAAAMTNARTKLVFACGRDDAGTFTREFGHGLKAEELVSIDPFEAVVAVFAGGRTQPPATSPNPTAAAVTSLGRGRALREPSAFRSGSGRAADGSQAAAAAAGRIKQGLGWPTSEEQLMMSDRVSGRVESSGTNHLRNRTGDKSSRDDYPTPDVVARSSPIRDTSATSSAR
ncbi:MAG: type IV secretory system conjugative DNA transfer family protein [Acidimicrobiia bacterium]|nr:type IV secretory system conjugative DNA transfer family protein [Acidimicrobiia bacterium]